MSDQPTVLEALLEVMRDVPEIKKGDRNTFHNFMFRGVERVVNHVGPALRKHGVVMLPVRVDYSSRDIVTEKGKTHREVTVLVDYTFTGPAGDSVTVQVPGEANDASGSATSKAMSVAQRIALLQAFTIATSQVDPEAEPTTRAADPVLAAKQGLKAIADEREWTIEQLATEYYEWSTGGDLTEATLEQLLEYTKHLKPPRRMSRAKAGES